MYSFGQSSQLELAFEIELSLSYIFNMVDEDDMVSWICNKKILVLTWMNMNSFAHDFEMGFFFSSLCFVTLWIQWVYSTSRDDQ